MKSFLVWGGFLFLLWWRNVEAFSHSSSRFICRSSLSLSSSSPQMARIEAQRQKQQQQLKEQRQSFLFRKNEVLSVFGQYKTSSALFENQSSDDPSSSSSSSSSSSDESNNEAAPTTPDEGDSSASSSSLESPKAPKRRKLEKSGFLTALLLAPPLFLKFLIVLIVKFLTDVIVFPLLYIYRVIRVTKNKIVTMFNGTMRDGKVNGSSN